MKRKFFASIIAGVMAFVCALPLVGAVKASANAAAEPVTLDMYLIAGQSNASGYSLVRDQTEEFENVWYAGQTEKVLGKSTNNPPRTNSNYVDSFDKYQRKVIAGLGSSGSYLGPEYGMAKVLNDYYTGSDKKAFIFKTAAGGTFLLDKGQNDSGLPGQYGNWYPRSLWPADYEPNIETASQDNDVTGILYKLFVENFRKVYNTLKEEGYNPVVKGMVWMQGENDLNGISDEYGDTLKAFITDMRNDLTSITGDGAVQAMPFVIGKIAPSFQGSWNSAAGRANMTEMHRQQERMVTELGGVATVSTDDLIIVDQAGNTVGSDVSHFNAPDMVTLGQRFATSVRTLMGSTLIAPNAINGRISQQMINETTYKFTFASNGPRYEFSALKVNGEDKTADVVNGDNGLEYTLENASGMVVVEAIFTELPKFDITYEANDVAGFELTPKYVYRGDTLSLIARANNGYKVEKVFFNDTEMTYNAETQAYEIVITKAGKVTMEVSGEGVEKPVVQPKPELPQQSTEDTNPQQSSQQNTQQGMNCASIIVANSLVVSLGAIACGMLLSKKREK